MNDNSQQFSVICNDALRGIKTLKSASIDAVISDPPYCSGASTEAGKQQAAGQGLRSENLRTNITWFANDNMTTAGLVWLLRELAIESKRVLKKGGHMLIFTDWRMVPHLAPALESSGLRYRNQICWDKGAMGLGTGFRPAHEFILHFSNGAGVYHDKSIGNVIRCQRVHHTERSHPTQKPVSLLETLVRVTTPVGGTVLDAFCGSGSTGIACLNLRRRFVGIDSGGVYVQEATRRILEHAKQTQKP